MRASVDHAEKTAVEMFCREALSSTSAMAPGSAATINVAIAPLSKLCLFLLPKTRVEVSVTVAGETRPAPQYAGQKFNPASLVRPFVPPLPDLTDATETVPLIRLAWGRSGDKGNLFNVAVLARKPEFLPYIRAALPAQAIAAFFAHLSDKPLNVSAYEVPGFNAINYVVPDSMDGGILMSPRVDNAAKGMAQQLLEFPVRVPPGLLD